MQRMISTTIRSFRLLFILLLVSLSTLAQQKTDVFHISGRIRVDNGDPTGSVVTLNNLSSKSTENKVTVNSSGKFEFDLKYFTEYKLSVVKDSHYTKEIEVSTIVPPLVWAKDSIFPPYPIVVTIYKKVPDVVLSFEGKVVGKICYSPKGKLDNFDSDIYIDDKEIRREIDQALKEHEDELFNKKMAEAIEFEKKNQIREAIKAYEEALAIRKNDQFIKPKLKELASDLKNLEKDALLESEFNKLVALGDENVASLKYALAIDNFKGALSIKPGNQTASDKLTNAEQLLAKLNADKAKVEAEFNRLLAAGDDNVSVKKYTEAIGNYKGALGIKPGDQVATSKLANAEQLLAKLNADKAKQEAEFNRLLAAGDENVSGQKYTEAIGNFKGALGIKPGDQVATSKLSNAEQLLAKLNADKAKVEAEFNRLLAAGDDNVSVKKYTEAIGNYKGALGIKPGDQVATSKLANAEQLLAKLNADKAKQEAEFNRLLAAGDDNVSGQKYTEAIGNYKGALSIKPGDQVATSKLSNAEQLLAKLNADKAKVEAEFNRLLAAGDDNVAAKKYTEAIGNFKGALSIKPGDQIATSKLANAEQLLAKLNADKAKQEAEFKRLLAAGDDNVAGKKYSEAIDNFKGALGIKPGDQVANSKLANAEQLLAKLNADKAKLEAEFTRLLAAGDDNVSGQKYPEAIGNYKGALGIKSGDQVATSKLANAEQLLAKLNADKAKQEAEFKRLLAAGDDNVAGKKYSEAIDNFKGALGIKPGDQVATSKLANAEQLLAKLNADKAKLEAEFNRLLAAGDENVTAQKYPEGIINFKDALKVKPGDAIASAKLAGAEKMLAAIIAERQKKEAAEKQKLQGESSYQKNIQTADANYAKSLWSVAIFYYQEALKFKSADTYALGRVEDCNKLINSNITAEKMQEYNSNLKNGDSDLAAKKYSSARFYYGKASEILPWEIYPKDQIKVVEKLISSTDSSGTEAQYFDAITKADEAVKSKNFAIARFYYQKAVSLKPGEEYPKQQLKRLATE